MAARLMSGRTIEDVQQVAQSQRAPYAVCRVRKLRRRELLGRNRADILRSRQTEDIKSELVESDAVDFGESHLKHDLPGRRHRSLQQVRDLGADVLRHFHDLVGDGDGRDVSGQHDGVPWRSPP